ncbi:MAG: class I SAM-dependent methyltransferase [Anaerolineales bacterium]|nr:class I SAM-dependent methyltransferase [Anaerolineales bacterium]
MDHADHVALLKKGVPADSVRWADMGAGSGAFSLALAELLDKNGELYAVDRDSSALRRLEREARARAPHTVLHPLVGDFMEPLDLPPLDGLVMANSLHYYQDKVTVIERMKDYLAPGGRFILIEYDTDQGNRWVPHPISFKKWATVAQEAGLSRPELLETRPSRFLGAFYSALSFSLP